MGIADDSNLHICCRYWDWYRRADQEKIFQPFQQVDGTTSRKYNGTGIGLALAKKLVDLQGGNIRVDSKINKGSTFTFMLPT